MGEAKAPVLVVVGGAVGDQLRSRGIGEEVRAQLIERERAADRDAVVEDVQVRVGEVRDPLAARSA
jgi:hypothetical protein